MHVWCTPYSNTFDELVVGAPLYRADGTAPETGRIFVYSNNNVRWSDEPSFSYRLMCQIDKHKYIIIAILQGALSLVRTIVGREAFSRFGHALANLGDISGDGFDGK